MKRITLRTGGKFPTREVLRIVCEQSPQKPLTVPEIRQRVKMLDILDDGDSDTLVIEDETYSMLTKALNDFPWQQAHHELLRVIDDVLEASNVSTAPLKSVREEREEDAA